MMIRSACLLLIPLLAPEGVREVKDLAYVDGPDADPRKQRLDLYLPQGATKFPVLMWIHGGAWSFGDRSWFGDVGRRFAEEGIGAAIISYRLSPKVKHPAHVEDCARAFAWLRDHIAEYGGDPERLFVSGQSAGGHLSALLACDPRYLQALGVPADAIKGALPMSGVYTIPALPPDTRGLLGIFPESFGSDPKVCRDASPAAHLSGLSAPMLVVTETDDAAPLRFDARCLREAAKRSGVTGLSFIDAERRNHFSIVIGLAARTADPTRAAMVDFIRARCRELDR
jgi:acetyl esterase/lipase